MPSRLRLLGAPCLAEGEDLRILPFNKPTSLLFYLACRGTWTRRSELGLIYRPDGSEEEASSYLRKIVFRARQLTWTEGLEVTTHQLRWAVDCDVRRHLRAVEEGNWAEAFESYKGELLAGLSLPAAPGYNAWLELERESLANSYSRSAKHLARELEQAGAFDEATRVLRKAFEANSLDEDLLQALLRVLKAAGEQGLALQLYDAFRHTLKTELNSEPLAATVALVDGLQAPNRPTRRIGAALRLPDYGTPFVGRREQVDTIRALVTDRTARLVSIVGLGGTGKTRLAVEAARALEDQDFERIAFVPLAGLQAEDDLVSCLLVAFGLTAGSHSDVGSLARHLNDKSTLLILDNFEHLASQTAVVRELLSAAEGLTLLVTSRCALDVPEERRVELAGLHYNGTSRIEGDMSEAMTLFVTWANRLSSEFVPTRNNLRAIERICRHVEGMPLAIELAAGWTRVLGPEKLADAIVDDLKLLGSFSSDASSERSVQSVFDYTWDRLKDSERHVLARMAAFRSSFSFEAAQAVANASLPDLLSLINRALVRRVDENRFELHQLLRQYLAQKVDLEDACDAHARYFADYLGQLTTLIIGGDQVEALRRVQLELDNVLQMWDHAARSADECLLDSCLTTLDYYFHLKSLLPIAAEAFQAAREGLERKQRSPEVGRTLARLVTSLANYRRNLGELKQAREDVDFALDLANEYGNRGDIGRALVESARFEESTGSYRSAEASYSEVLELAREIDDNELMGAAYSGLASLASFIDGNQPRAIHYGQECYRSYAKQGDLEGVNTALINLGASYFHLHNFGEAARCWREAAEIARQLGYRKREAVVLNNLGLLCQRNGDEDDAKQHFTSSLALREELGDRRGTATVLINLGGLAMERGDFEEARTSLNRALVLYEQLGDRAAAAQAKGVYARCLLALGDTIYSERLVVEALELAREVEDHSALLGAVLALAELERVNGSESLAARLALAVHRSADGAEEGIRFAAERLLVSMGRDVVDDTGRPPDSGLAPTGQHDNAPFEALIATSSIALLRNRPDVWSETQASVATQSPSIRRSAVQGTVRSLGK